MGCESCGKSAVSTNPLSYRFKSAMSTKQWLEAKRIGDNAEGLWRIDDKIYDLINFIPRHPGGADWLKLTQGTDITELFESHHISTKAEMLLPHFFVKRADKPRNYKFTFCDDGFYKTLKIKAVDQFVVLRKKKTSASVVSNIKVFSSFFRSLDLNFSRTFTPVSSWERSSRQSLPLCLAVISSRLSQEFFSLFSGLLHITFFTRETTGGCSA